MAAIGFGQSDPVSWANINSKFAQRNVETVGQLTEWMAEEVLGLLRGLDRANKLQKTPRAYLSMIASHLDIRFQAEDSGSSDPAGVGQAADWASHCTKLRPSPDFNTSKYIPDGRVWAALPAKGTKTYLEQQDEQLFGDLIWLDAHANPEPSFGEYIPTGMAGRLSYVASMLIPPLKPSKKSQRTFKVFLNNRFTNGRNGFEFKRIVLDSLFRPLFSERCAARIRFVEAGDEELDKNTRNDIFTALVKVHKGELPVSQPCPSSLFCLY